MASISETGHDKNVAGAEKLIAECKALGTDYNPSNPALGIPMLEQMFGNAKQSLLNLKTVKPIFDKATAAREGGFNPLVKLVTRSIAALSSSGAPVQIIGDARTLARKIQGRRATPKTVPEGDSTTGQPEGEAKNISVSQQSYDSLIEHFDALIQLYKAEPMYNPNEPDLKTGALETYCGTLRTLNTAVINASIPYSEAMNARNKILYAPVTGVVDTSKAVKKYVMSVLGASHPTYKRINAIPFKNLLKD